MGWLARLGALGLGVGLSACAADVIEDADSSDGALRTDASATVPTTDPAVRVLSGYNAFLDRATPTSCVSSPEPRLQAGAVTGSFYLMHVKTRDDLAKELDVELNASVKAPTEGSVDASTKVVQTFKQSTTRVSFLLRAVRSYTVTNTGSSELTANAVSLLKKPGLAEFIHQCGGSFAQSVRYEAQVIAMLEFDAKTEESARTIETSFGGATPAAKTDIAPSAAADLKTKAQQTASANAASLSITVTTAGFVSGNKTNGDPSEDSFDRIDALYKELSDSFDKDLAGDRANYLGNQRNVRPTQVAQASYGSLSNRPDADYAKLSTILGQAEEFVSGLSPLYLRVEHAYQDEVSRFLGDESNQFRYNLEVGPKPRTSDLLPIAKTWEQKLRPDGDTSVVKPLRTAIDRCTSAAANGDYGKCASDAALDKAKNDVSAALAAYAKSGRILPLNVARPSPGSTMSFWNAEGDCDKVGMRLPKRSEMAFVAPAVPALAPASAQVWVAADGACDKPVFANPDGRGEGTFSCITSWLEPLPWTLDQPVVCVGLSGPITARPAP